MNLIKKVSYVLTFYIKHLSYGIMITTLKVHDNSLN